MRRRALPLLLLLALLALPARGPARAQSPDQVEAFVYGINATIPGAVIGTFAPPSVDTLYLLADLTSILSPRRTLVYYWPITNEYRAAWSQLNEQVEGTLEVVRGGQVVATVAQTDYTIHFSSGQTGARPQLYVGSEALEADAAFQAAQRGYRQAVQAYEEARARWLESAREAQARGETPSQSVAAPEPPPPLNLFSTGMNRGYPLSLPAGRYAVRTRLPDGSIAPESERDLIVFGARRSAVGYEVVPETRWTFPEQLNDLSDLILAEPGTVVYLKPQIVREYPDLAYQRLQDPQYAGDTSGAEWTWVGGERIDEGVLEVVRADQVIDRLALQPYFVRQTAGRELGYEILPYDPATPNLTPRVDFVGYRLELAPDRPAFAVRLRSPEQDIMVGSIRQIRVAPSVRLPLLLAAAVIPLALGAGILTWRRRQTGSAASSQLVA